MAEFDPQEPADHREKNQAGQCEDSGSCCGGHARREENEFVADWSGAEKTLEAQAAAFEATHAAPRTPEAFWVELVQSQSPTQDNFVASNSTGLAARPGTAVGVQSEQFWVDLVASQKSAAPSGQLWADLVASQKTGEAESSAVEASPVISSLSNPPTGMGWSDDEAAEWSAPEGEQERREYDPVQPAAEPVEAEASARRDDVEWSTPASAEQDWASARSEGLRFEPSAEGETESQPSLMAAAVEAAQKQAKAKKTAAKKAVAKKPAAKKPAVKKTVKAKKPAAPKKAAAKKPAARKVVKKVAPPPKITKAPTRRAA